jgi:hypothetical protein
MPKILTPPRGRISMREHAARLVADHAEGRNAACIRLEAALLWHRAELCTGVLPIVIDPGTSVAPLQLHRPEHVNSLQERQENAAGPDQRR